MFLRNARVESDSRAPRVLREPHDPPEWETPFLTDAPECCTAQRQAPPTSKEDGLARTQGLHLACLCSKAMGL